MYCPVYHITMGTAYCLLYQERAVGTAKRENGTPPPMSILGVWKQKYRPCLDCERGKKVRENGEDMDSDVVRLKGNYKRSGGQCKKCGEWKDDSEFYISSTGKVMFSECKKCASIRHKSIAAAKKADKHIDQIQPNIAPEAEENQVDNIDQNTPVPPPVPVDISLVESTPKHAERTCERCGYTGQEDKFHIAGYSGRVNVCRKCVWKSRQANVKAKKESTVILDFSEYPEILDKISAKAKQQFRTVQNEILFRLVIADAQ